MWTARCPQEFATSVSLRRRAWVAVLCQKCAKIHPTESKGVLLRAKAGPLNVCKPLENMEGMKRMGKAELPTQQGVGCSNHPGRTNPFKFNQLACDPSASDVDILHRRFSLLKTELVVNKGLISGREHLLEKQVVEVLNHHGRATHPLATKPIRQFAWLTDR